MRRLAALAALLAVGCAPALSAPKVAAVRERPAGACEELAPVEGDAGGAMGAWISNDALREGASNDARNKAAREGATVVWLGEPAYETRLGSVAGVRVAGRAFRCAP